MRGLAAFAQNFARGSGRRVFAATAALGFGWLAAPAGAQVTFTPLGRQTEGDRHSIAWAVSADGGTTVGCSLEFTGKFEEALRWSGTQRGDMGHLPGGQTFSQAYGVSSNGKVIVGYSDSANGEQAFRWENGQMVSLDGLGQSAQTRARGIAANGVIIVGSSTSVSATEAVRWVNGIISGLGDLPGDEFSSIAYAASANGAVVVGQGTSDKGVEAFRWENGQMIGLGDLPGGEFNSEALGVSADGSVIVGFGGSAAGREAVRWVNGAIEGLGDLPGGPVYAQADGVSSDGSVVVGYGSVTDFDGDAAFLWREDLKMVELQPFILNHGATLPAGWRLFEAQAISTDGTTIVGWGRNPDNYYEAFTLRASSPGGFMTLGASRTVSGQIAQQGLAQGSAPREVIFELRRRTDASAGAGVPIRFALPLGTGPGPQAFSFPLPPGEYALSVKGATCLRQSVTIGDSTSNVTLPAMTLLNGDVNNDNRVNLTDLVLLRANYGKQGADLAGDLNGDGRVNLTDLVLLRQNYGKTGAA